ncbi:MAG: hypothetical protein KAV87_51870 [Desulfobacteraceae bacterium]|nr:hypothetical protein [Desulfobacteraceae bacterium]
MKTRFKFAIGAGVGFAALIGLFLFSTVRAPVSMYSLPPATPAPLTDVDRILANLDYGNIAFNAPKNMNLYGTAVIELVLGVKKTIEELKGIVKAEGEKIGANIRISDRMEARLSGRNFSITAVTPETQAVSRTEVTEWKWEINPKKSGRHFLHLTLSVLLELEGSTTPRAIRTFDRIIEVNVTWYQSVSRFTQKNWQWLWAAILVPFVGWLWKRKRAASKKANNQIDS